MKIKRLLVAVMGAGLLLSACTPAEEQYDETYSATIWVSEVEGMDTLTQRQINEFAKETKIKINATIEKQSESDAASKMLKSVANGADIYCFPQDQLARLVKANALSKLGANSKAAIEAENDDASVSAVTIGTGDTAAMYAYPLTSDNGYFLYYDKTIVQQESVGDVFRILTDCETANKKFSFNVTESGWYTASWFFGAGCKSEWTADDLGNFTAVDDDFATNPNGLLAAKALARFTASTAFVSSDAAGDFSAGSAAVVTGTWSYKTIKATLGTNMGVAELPSFTQDGETFHLGSFKGCKLMGVKPQADPKKAVALNKLATYLTGEKCQLDRFQQFGWGPSNKVDQNLDEVKNDPMIQALRAQEAHATVQGQINGAWWNFATALAKSLKASGGDQEAIATALATYKSSLDSVFDIDVNGWLYVGSHNGWDNADGTMVAKDNGEGGLSVTFEVGADDGYKGGRFVHPTQWEPKNSWDLVDSDSQALLNAAYNPVGGTEDNGDHNIVLAEAGMYRFTLTVNDQNEPTSIHIEKL